jgi:hypothetical protein
MEKIIITEKVETDKDKYVKYGPTGCPKRFIELDEKQKENADKYQFSNNVDKLVRALAGTSVCFYAGELATEIPESTYFKMSVAAPFIKVLGSISIGHAETLRKAECVGSYEDSVLGRIVYSPPQGEMFLRLLPRELYSRIFYPFSYRAWIEIKPTESALNVIEKPKINFLMRAELERLGKIFDISAQAAGVIINFSREFFVKALAGEIDENYLGLKKKIYEQKKAEKDFREGLTVQAIRGWIIKKFGLAGPATKPFNGTEQNIVKKGKNQIFNKFLAACIHMQNPEDARELKLEGDYLVCPHGNQIRCRHTADRKIADVEKFLEEFGEKRGTATICRICGEQLIKNPSIGYSVFGPRNNATVADDTRKYIYRRCMIASAYMRFNDQVSEEYVSRLAGNVVSAVIGTVSAEMNKIDKSRGVAQHVILAMKEIVCQIYVMCAYFILAEKNKDAFTMRAKHTVEGVAKVLQTILADKIEAVKEMREIHLENLVSMVIEELTGRSIKAPREFSIYDERDTEIFRYLASVAENMAGYPEIKLKSGHPEIAAVLLENVKFLGTVLAAGEFNPQFAELLEKWKKLAEAEYLKESGSIWRKYLWTPKLEPAIYRQMDFKYLGISVGEKTGLHTHIFRSGTVAGKIKPFSAIELDEKIDTLVCSICGQEGAIKNLLGAIIEEVETDSKQKYFAVFCPVNFSHDFTGGKCKFCGYIPGSENTDFFKKYKLPSKILTLKEEKKSALVFFDKKSDVLEEKVKYVGKTTKAEYSNFWLNLGRWEDVTYKDFSEGKAGSEILGIEKIKSSLVWLASLLARIKNLKNKPDPVLQELNADVGAALDLTVKILANREVPDWVNYKNSFIKVFNMLPDKVADYVVKNLIKFAKKYAKSDESTYADALSHGYRTNDFQDNTDIEEGQTGKLESIYEGMDYNGKNEK